MTKPRNTRPRFAALTICLALTACPLAAAEKTGIRPVDYSQPGAWLALPGQPSTADLVPKGSGLSNLQDRAVADVFYIHPTTGMRKDVENVPIDDPEAQKTASLMLMAQATPFNAVARVFAPRYSQIAFHVFDFRDADLQAPMNRAYADVRRAFDFYIANYNHGRPFFLVGHSQGANHGLRLLVEAIRNTPLERLLVAAYLPGGPVPRSLFTSGAIGLPLCAQPGQTGCVAIWGVFGEGYVGLEAWEKGNVYWDPQRRRWMRPVPGQPLASINPVSWSEREPRTPLARHLGGVPFGAPGTHFSRPRPGLVSARDDGRFVFVAPPLAPELFNDGGVFGGPNYHVFDISLFWADVRENARRRLKGVPQTHGDPHLRIVSPTAVSAEVGRPFHFRVEADRPGATFEAKGLPPGLSLRASDGTVSGRAERPGVYAVVVSAANASGTAYSELALTVTEAARGQSGPKPRPSSL